MMELVEQIIEYNNNVIIIDRSNIDEVVYSATYVDEYECVQCEDFDTLEKAMQFIDNLN